MNITIIGSGVYALATLKELLDEKNDIRIWSEKAGKKEKEIVVPENVLVTNSFEEALKDSNIIFILTASKYAQSVLEKMKDYVKDDQLFVIGSKGILEGGVLIKDLVIKYFPNNRVGVISGPTFAIDIQKLEPTGFTFATKEYKDYELIKHLYKKSYIEYSNDLTAVSLSGTLKNVYAIGNGILEGLNLGYSSKCLLVYKAYLEMKHIFKSLNLNENEAESLAGMGDLILTSTSITSRNYSFGMVCAYANNEAKEEFLNKNTVEGYENLKLFKKYFEDKKIDVPLINAIYDVVISNKNNEEILNVILHY